MEIPTIRRGAETSGNGGLPLSCQGWQCPYLKEPNHTTQW